MDENRKAVGGPEDPGAAGTVTESDGADDVVVEDADDEVAALERKLAEEHDRLLRTAAELENVRKRARRDVDDAAIRGRSEILSALLPALDSIDLALKGSDRDGPAGPVLDGVEMIRRQFLAATTPFGLKEVSTGGARFDPAFHEAVVQVPSADHPAGEIVEELRKGYVLGERLVRASMVVVSSGAPAPPGPGGTAADGAEPEGSGEAAPQDDEVQ